MITWGSALRKLMKGFRVYGTWLAFYKKGKRAKTSQGMVNPLGGASR